MRRQILTLILAAGLGLAAAGHSQPVQRDPEVVDDQWHVLVVNGVRVGSSLTGPLIEASGTDVKLPGLVVGSSTLSGTELGYLDGLTLGTVTASKAVTVDSNKDAASFRDITVRDIKTTGGVGAVAGSGVTLVEYGTAAVHKTVFTLTAASVTVTDTGGANGAQGNFKIYDFPEGVIVRGGCVANATTLAGAGGIADGAAVVLSLGSVAAGVGDATLTTTEADFIASFAGTLTAGAGTFAKYGEPSVTSLDGHTTAVDLILNVAVPDADVSASDTLAVTGTITCIWSNSGDF